MIRRPPHRSREVSENPSIGFRQHLFLVHASRIASLVDELLGTPGRDRIFTPTIAVILGVSFSLLTITHLWGRAWPQPMLMSIHTVTLAALCVLIVARPVWGIIVIAASFPVAGILPPVGFTTSTYPLLGAAMLLGYGREHIFEQSSAPTITLPHVLGLLLVVWITASNPTAATITGDRVWLWTYLQLLVLVFLTSQLLKDPSAHRTLMIAFVVGATISAYVAIHQVQFGLTSAASVRGRGLAEGVNDAGRYYVLAIVFLAYLRHAIAGRWMRWSSIAAIVILLGGLAATVSRTSVLLLLFAVVMMTLERTSLLKERLFEFGVALAAAALLVIPMDYWRIISGIVSSILQGQDSVGFRYGQWDAGLGMWADHPIAGVGIGQFENNSVYYGTNFIPFYGIRWSAHNTYITLLAETGAVGFALFMAMIVAAGVGLKRAWLRDHRNTFGSLHYTWLTVFVIMLLGAITGDDHTHKLMWLICGIGAAAHTPLRQHRT